MKTISPLAGLILLAAFISVAGCGPKSSKPGPAPVPQSSATCDQMCASRRVKGCKDADPTPGGEPCEVWCEHYGDHRPSPLPYGIKIDCMMTAACDDTAKCGR